MGVFDAFTTIVLEAGRMERPQRPMKPLRELPRLRLSHMPDLRNCGPILVLLGVLIP